MTLKHNDINYRKAEKSIKVGTKVYILVGFCLGLLLLVSGVGIFQMNKIGVEIEGIAERDLPLTNALTKITVHQLEQAIFLERAFRIAVLLDKHQGTKKEFDVAAHKFEELNKLVETEFKSAEEIAQRAYDSAVTIAARHEFSSVLKVLKHLHKNHVDYDHQSERAFKSIRVGNFSGALSRLPKIEAEENDLRHGLEKILLEVETFTENAAITAEHQEHFALKIMLAISLIAILMGGFLTRIFVRGSISRPLEEVVLGLDALNKGDMSVDVKVYSHDEIGTVAKSYATFKESSIEKQREEQLRANERRKRDELGVAMDKFTVDFSTSIEGIVETVSSTSAELNATAQSMNDISEQTSDQAAQASQASEQTSSNVQSVASATEEMTATIGEIGQQVEQASNASKQAVAEVSNTSAQMSALTETASKIGAVVEMISSIAAQTNLLALNATIESARAGEAGKGFAVVAGEVKQLASQTAKATSEIAEQIGDIQKATKQASGSMESVSEAISKVDEISTAIAAAIEEQSAATQEIAANVNQAAMGTQQVNDNISLVSDASQEAGAASGQVMSAAGELSQQASLLKGEVDKFITQVRAG